MREGNMNAALLHNWFCAVPLWCLGKTKLCAERDSQQ